jgi:general secretion pathway protein A
MYLSHYGFKKRPFSISPDPSFLWLGEKHSEGLASLRYGILESKGFLLLTGDIGTGKTAMVNRLIRQINLNVIVATIPDPNMELIDFYNILADEFKMDSFFESKGDFLIHFKRFLVDTYGHHKKALLIIDEAQRLDHELLEEIRLLSNIEFDNRKLINIFLVGQSELRKMLLEERNKSFRHRIAVYYHIEPLNAQETASYIEYRIKVAGSSWKLFSTEAIGEIHNFSQGYPRLINIICDNALMSGYAAGLAMIDGDIVRECASELQIFGNVDAPRSKQPASVRYDPPSSPPTVNQHETLAEQPKIINYIDFPEKRSNFKVAGIYIIFIILFALAVSLIFSARFKQSPGLTKRVNDILKSAGIVENKQKVQQENIISDENPTKTVSDQSASEKLQKPENIEEIYISNKIPENTATDGQSNILADNELFKARLTEEAESDHLTDYDALKARLTKEAQSSIVADSEAFKAQPEGKGSSADQEPIVNGLKTSSVEAVDQTALPIPSRSSLMSSGLKFIVYFSPNSTGLTSNALEIMHKITEILSQYPDASIFIEGYGSSYGNSRYNQKLSQLRANVVKSYFVRQGVAKSRIKTTEIRSTNPLGANATQPGNIKEHQVEINVKIRPKGDPAN